MNRTRRAAILGLLALAASSVAVVPAGASSGASHTVRTVQKARKGFITSYRYANGDTMRVYASGPVTVTNRSSKFQAMTADSTTTTTSQSESSSVTPTTTDKASFGSSASAYDQLIALGVSSADATPYKELDTSYPTTDPIGPNVKTSGATTATTGTQISEAVCASRYADGGKLHMYGCDRTFRVGTYGSVWYLEDKFLATVSMHDSAPLTPDNVTGLKFGVQYKSGNQMENWDPSSTKDEGSCANDTVGLSYKGVSISDTHTECPETFGYWNAGTTFFASKWDGQGNGPSNGARNAHGVTAVYNGATASPYPGIYWQYWWVS